MARKPQKPQKGQPAIKEIYNSVCDIIDYLPSLEVVGDQKSTYVTKSSAGTVIHAKQPNITTKSSTDYIAGSGIVFTSGNIINAKLSAGPNIKIDYNSGWLVISGTPAGSGGGGGGGQEYYNGRFITISSDFSINCTLSALSELYNPPFVESSNIVMPNSLTACNNTVDISQVGSIYNDHFIQTRDILYDGVGTKVSLAWMRNPFGDQDPGGTNGIVQGLQVDLTLSGGRFADVVLHKHVYGAYDPNTGTRYDPPTESRVDCLLTGTYDRYPHTSGFIDVVPVEMEDGKTWGVISTNLHAGSGIAIDPQTGEITATGGGGGTTVIFKAPDFAKLQVQNDAGETAIGLGTTFLVPVENGSSVRYSADGGTIIARWAPVEGSNENAFDVTTTNQTTTDDGYVRISVIDDGTLSAGCLRLYVDNKDIPLHKFARFNYSSGAIYEAGRYMQIQTTSTRINAETELEEEYTLENPIINNMLTGGTWITIQQTEMVGGVEQQLKYPRINCDLSEGTNIQITTGGVINCTLTGTSQLTNDSNYITTVDIPPSTTYIGESGIAISTILDENQQPTTSANIYISADFYDKLTNPTSNRVLSCSNGILTWAENTGGSTPTPTPGGGNVVYITQQGEYDLQGNTHYYVLLDPVLSTDQNYSPDQQEWYKIYKYMWGETGSYPDQTQTIWETIERYDSQNDQYLYGAWKGEDEWEEYGAGGVFGAKLNFPVPQATTHISITAFRNSNCIVCAPYGGCIWDWSDPSRYPLSGTSGMWFGEFLQRMNKDFIFDPSTQRWYQVNS